MAKTEIQMTEADFAASQRTFYKTRLWMKAAVVIAGLLCLLVVALAADLVLSGRSRNLLDLAPLTIVAIGWGWLFSRYIWGTPPGTRRYFRQSDLKHPLEYSWSPEAIAISGPNFHQRMAWDDALRWSEDRASIIIVRTERSYVPVPKRLFAATALDELRACLADVRRV